MVKQTVNGTPVQWVYWVLYWLIFLIVHLSNFWVVSRFTGIPTLDANGHEDLFAVMKETFSNVWIVILYVLAMVSLVTIYYMVLHLHSRPWDGTTKIQWPDQRLWCLVFHYHLCAFRSNAGSNLCRFY